MVSTCKYSSLGLIFYVIISTIRSETIQTTVAKNRALTPNHGQVDRPAIASRFFDFNNILGSLFGTNRGTPENKIFQPAVAVQGPFNRPTDWNPSMQEQGSSQSQEEYHNNDQARYPQDSSQNDDHDRYPNQEQGQFLTQADFGNNRNQNFDSQRQSQSAYPIKGGPLNLNDQRRYPNQDNFQNSDRHFSPGEDQFPTQGIIATDETPTQNVNQQKYLNGGASQVQSQPINPGDFMNTDDLPNKVILNDHDSIYDTDQWYIQNQRPSDQIQEQAPEQGLSSHLRPPNMDWSIHQSPTQKHNQGAQTINQRPTWLNIGQGIFPGTNFNNKGTQIDDLSTVSLDKSGQTGKGNKKIPSFITPDNSDNSTTASTSTHDSLKNNTQSSTTANPVMTECVQDCSSTTEYNPVCGSNNVTYFNGGKFKCAQNCGLDIHVLRRGRCQGDVRRGLKDRIQSTAHRRHRRANSKPI